jgi:hypothetical protein
VFPAPNVRKNRNKYNSIVAIVLKVL